MIYTFTKTTVWVKYHEIKQDVLIRIGEIIERHGAEIAFPTRMLHLHGGALPPDEAAAPGPQASEKQAPQPD
jgi:MscS family membrane protein